MQLKTTTNGENMATPNVTTCEQFERIKKNVEVWAKCFESNVKNFKESKRFAFESSLSDDDKSKLQKLGRPTMEFNMLEAYISRLLGEFSIINPSFTIKSLDDSKVSIETVDVISSLIRKISYQSQLDSADNETYKDILGGGFAAMRVCTRYTSPTSFEQDIYLERCHNPAMVGFDPMATKPHKGDGKYCYEIYPMEVEDFKQKYPDIKLNFKASASRLNIKWFWKDAAGKEYLNVCEYFEFDNEKIKIHLMGENKDLGISDAQVMTDEELKEITERLQGGSPFLPPVPRETQTRFIPRIYRYLFIGDQCIESRELTDFDILPIVFIDGNSLMTDKGQMTRPYIYQAKDAQRAKNIIANSFLGEVENLRAAKITIAEEALPTNTAFMDAYLNPQANYSALIYRMFDPNGRQHQAPTVIPNAPIAPELYASFSDIDNVIQKLLGSYDAQQGLQTGDLSGKAIIEGATQSNSAAKPFIINYIASWAQLARIIISLIPKIYVTPRTIPTMTASGSRSYVKINGGESPISLQYEPNCLDLYVTEGASFEIQKKEALKLMTAMAPTNQGLNAILSGTGLPILIDNMDVKGADKLKAIAEAEIAAAEEAKKKGPPEPPPQVVMQMKELELRGQQMQLDSQLKQMQMQLDREKMQNDILMQQVNIGMKMAQLTLDQQELQGEMERAQSADEREQINQRMKMVDSAFAQLKFITDKNIDMHKHESLRADKKTSTSVDI